MINYKTDLAYIHRDFMTQVEMCELRRSLRGLHKGKAGDYMFLEHITGTKMQHEHNDLLLEESNWYSPKIRKRDIIRYYLYSGVPIQKIIQERSTSQGYIYKIKDYEWSTANNLTPILEQFPQIRYNIQRLRQSINILGGYSPMQ